MFQERTFQSYQITSLKKNKERKNKIIINLAWHISREIRNYIRTYLKFNGKIIDIISTKDFK